MQTRARYHPAKSCSIILTANKGSLPSCTELFYYTPCKQGLNAILRRAVLLYSLQTGARYHPAQSCSIILPANRGSIPSCAELFYYTACKQRLDTILCRAVLLYSLQTRARHHPAQSCYTPCKWARYNPAQNCSIILPANKGSIQSSAELFYYTPCKQGLDTILLRAVLLYSLQTRARYHPVQSCSIIRPANRGSIPSCAELFYYTPCKQGLAPSCVELFCYTPRKQGLDTILRRAVLLYSLQTRAR